jgi:hypothetical protein
LRLGCNKWDLSQIRAYYSLIRKPELALFVKRLTIKYRGSALGSPPSLNFIAKKLFPLLTSLKIISCPLICNIDQWPLSGEITILQSHFARMDYVALSGLSRWDNIRILSVTFESDAWILSFNSQLDILFPRLQFLQLFTLKPEFIRYITLRWQLPGLKTLSINGTRSSVWGGLLENNRGITKLCVLVLEDTNQLFIPQDITFPQLQTLYFRAKCSEVYETIHAPRLERYGLYCESPTNASEISGSVRRAIAMFPSIKYVDLSVRRFGNISLVLQAKFMKEFEFMHGTGIKLEVGATEY